MCFSNLHSPNLSTLTFFIFHREMRLKEEAEVYVFLQAASSLLPANKNNLTTVKRIVDCVGLDAMLCLRQAADKMLRNLSGSVRELLELVSNE